MKTNNYQNAKFDIIIFDEDDTKGFECYSDAAHNLKWDTDCTFSDKTQVFLDQDKFDQSLIGLDNLSKMTKHVIIDNTPLPKGGSFSEFDINAMLSVRTDYSMQYNIKHLTIYCGLLCLLLLFVIAAQIYLYCKLRKDTNSKK